MAKRKDDDEYEVGYGKPPRHKQFKPGQSGNPRGRTKDATTLAEILQKRLFTKVPVKENGKTKNMPVLEFIVGQVMKSAAGGDHRNIANSLKLASELPQAAADGSKNASGSPAADLLVLEEFVRMFGGGAGDIPGFEED